LTRRTFTRVLCAAFLGSGCALAAESNIGIFLQFEETPPSAILTAMQAQADALLAPTGVSVAWRLLSESSGNEVFSKIFVVKFTGPCKVPRWQSALPDLFPQPSTRLAASKVEGGRVLPWAEVECDKIGSLLTRIPAAQRVAIFSNALAKVLVHELRHMLLNSVRHSSAGLSRSVVDVEELVKR
jgi:hypothetical protein